MSEKPLIALRGVACVRGGRLLFQGLDLSLAPGEAALVTGPNGAGKSSLLRLAAGLLRPAAGEVERGAAIAFADEKLALDSRQTLGHALAFWARLDRAHTAPGIAAMDLAALADVPVSMLSTGQRKRAVLARAIAAGARLWLFDEPANGLDSSGAHKLETAIAAHRAGGGAVIVASHQPMALEGTKVVAL